MFVGHKSSNLLSVLIAEGKIRADQPELEHYKGLTNADIERSLRIDNLANSEDIGRAYAKIYGLPFIDLKNVEIQPATLEIIPESFARDMKIIPYSLDTVNKNLKLAIADPSKLSENLEERLNQLKSKSGVKLELSIITPEDFTHSIAGYQLVGQVKPEQKAEEQTPGVEKIDLKNLEIPYDIISKFPEDIARKYHMVVFGMDGDSAIKVAVADPKDPKLREILDFVKEKNDVQIKEYQAEAQTIVDAMRFYHQKPGQMPTIPQEPPKPKEEPAEIEPKIEEPEAIKPEPKKEEEAKASIFSQAKELDKTPEDQSAAKIFAAAENNLDEFLGESPLKTVDDLKAIAEEKNVPKIIAASVKLAVLQKASDIHIEPTLKDVRMRFRIDGILRDVMVLPTDLQAAMASRVKILSKLKIDETRIPQDGRFDVMTQNRQIDLRISTLPTVHGEKIAMRLLDKSAQLLTLEELGLAGRGLKILIDNIDKPFGIILSTGPTGSGKSTTLYAILSRISTAAVNIVTLEDPVEYEIPGVNQCQVKPKIGFTFANGLRSILRQDPNIIMVGEIRDSETASLATHAALTGHLVLSSLHTNDAAGTLPRLINMEIEPFLITSSINCVVAQRLVRKLCPKCKVPAHIPEVVQKEVEIQLAPFNFKKPYQFFEGKGCSECSQGYKGRIGIFEVMPMSEGIENLTVARRSANEIREQAVKEGMVTMKQDGLIKALKGNTSINEVLRVVTI